MTVGSVRGSGPPHQAIEVVRASFSSLPRTVTLDHDNSVVLRLYCKIDTRVHQRQLPRGEPPRGSDCWSWKPVSLCCWGSRRQAPGGNSVWSFTFLFFGKINILWQWLILCIQSWQDPESDSNKFMLNAEWGVTNTTRHCRHAVLSQMVLSMRSMCSMRGGFIFHKRGPLLKVHHSQCLTSMTKHDSGEIWECHWNPWHFPACPCRFCPLFSLTYSSVSPGCWNPRSWPVAAMWQNTYLLQGPPITENKPPTHRTHSAVGWQHEH